MISKTSKEEEIEKLRSSNRERKQEADLCYREGMEDEQLPVSLRKTEIRFVERTGVTPRIERLRLNYWLNKPTICIHHARIYTQVFKESESQPLPIRRAKAFKRLCADKPIVIQDDELIVGNPGCGPRFVNICPEISWQWAAEELDRFPVREQDPYLIDNNQERELREEIFPYWRGKSVYEYCFGHLPEETRRLTFKTGFIDNEVKQINGLGHCVPGYQHTVLPNGFKGIAEACKDNITKLSYKNPEDHEKIEYLQAMILSCEGMRILGERHAAEARRLAEKEGNPRRKEELHKIAEVCDWVPWNPPRTFWEAAQAVWFAEMAAYMEQSGPGLGLGRFDQYMYPYYRSDLEEGRLSKLGVQELMECLWIKNAEIIWLLDEVTSHFFGGYQLFLDATIGGTRRDGRDATNELTYMCMEATRDVKLHSPSLAARIHEGSPDEYLTEIAKTVQTGIGYPQMHNDKVGIPTMLSLGTSIEDAYDYDILGCSEIQIQGKMWKYSDGGQFNMGSCVDFALHDGWSKMVPSDKRWGLPTGDPREFDTYEDFEDAVKRQIAYLTEHLCICNMVTEQAHKNCLKYPYISTLMVGPAEKGVDFFEGGTLYNVGPAPSYIGLADVANSLAAVKRLVYDEEILSWDELLGALDSNFDGQRGQEIQLLLLNRGPKYGRDDPYVDGIAKTIADFCADEAHKYRSYRGCRFVSAMFPVAANTPLGLVVGALPSGRKAGSPLADGVSPQQGTDISPTEVVKSVSSYDHVRHENGLLLNMKFSPSVLEDERGLRNLVSLVKTFFQLGGWHIQVNVVSADTLKEAQRYPEKYPTLMVRVAGYSAFFNDLSKETQDDIISRTEHGHI